MSNESPRPLRRVNMNFFAENIDELQRRNPSGWTGDIRDIVDRELRKRKQVRIEADD